MSAPEPFDASAFLAMAARKPRVRLLVEAKLDPVPGWGHEPDDWQRMLDHYLETAVPHYDPSVTVVESASVAEAIERHQVYGKSPEETLCACDRQWRRDAEYRAHLAAAVTVAVTP